MYESSNTIFWGAYSYMYIFIFKIFILKSVHNRKFFQSNSLKRFEVKGLEILIGATETCGRQTKFKYMKMVKNNNYSFEVLFVRYWRSSISLWGPLASGWYTCITELIFIIYFFVIILYRIYLFVCSFWLLILGRIDWVRLITSG